MKNKHLLAAKAIIVTGATGILSPAFVNGIIAVGGVVGEFSIFSEV